ncbi:MAG: bifunctional oligoribonuclease/PAP phosphatase NrnA, partial [Candidatus Hydrogenedentota bacterium]
MTSEFTHLVETIEQHHSFLLLSHVDPDGDAIGSLIALLLLLERKGKRAVAYEQDGVPEIYRFLRCSDRIVSAIPPSEHFDVAMFLECPDVQRAGSESAPFIAKIPLWVNIDHHMENSRFGHLNIIESELSAVGEVIFDLFRAMGEPIDMTVAEALYTAIMTDTGSYKYTNTTPRAHEISAQLIKAGVNPYDMYQEIYENVSASAAMIAARAHSTLEVDDGVSCITITRAMLEQTGATAEDTHDIVNFGRGIKDVEVALLFRETDNGIKVSLRSRNYVNVSKIAVRFGGGGH